MCTSIDPDPPEAAPVLLVMIGQHRHVRIHLNVAESLQVGCALGLVIHGEEDFFGHHDEADGNDVWPPITAGCREVGDASITKAPPDLRCIHLASLLLYR